ncbi:type I-E CRISPR-associated protein Cas6/Cse3/CasE [Gordonia sp. DT101]|uniref:type I-E CRISPR-associated protein Cas6/Cse3/CasE n=1 Tax=Gordonia sp. DT101 TaxID=3416545 RepID=UPI003CF2073C
MYLTRMPINRRRRGAAKLLSNPEAMHAAVEASFAPGMLTDAGARALWRIDSPAADEIHLYIVSPVEPDLSHVVEQAGWQTGAMWQTRDYRPVLDAVQEGRRFSFRLRANPVRSMRAENSARTKPVAHVSVAQQEQWLLQRAVGNGFVVTAGLQASPAVRVVDRGVMRFGKGGGRRVTVAHATFEGVLEVTDAERLRRTLSCGIGRAKAYGCGLMTLAVPPDTLS